MRLTTTFPTNDGRQVWMDGWREPKYNTARFSIRYGDEFLDNLDWPTAYRFLAPKVIGQWSTRTEDWLRSVLPKL